MADKKLAGRPIGAIDKDKKEMLDAIRDDAGQTPLEYLLSVMNNTLTDPARRIEAAKAACPYVHSRLSSIDINATMHEAHEDALDQLD